ncbi:hypothetical protein MG293_010525 [Ovis ammon polii]|uniref:Uncharacterized protein n=1 Tax=Ovis ammon polii TaxID=230172 RepID=A0AAD4U2G7_OVIAM|nr:hypothetical protein MG293_010525 [Ovis ammon polii]
MLNLPPKKSEDKMCSSHCPKPICTKQHRARLSSRCHSGKHTAKRVGLGKRSCASCPGNGVSGNWNLGTDSSAKLPSLAVVQSAAGKAKRQPTDSRHQSLIPPRQTPQTLGQGPSPPSGDIPAPGYLLRCSEKPLTRRGHEFDPRFGQIPHDEGQLSLSVTTTDARVPRSLHSETRSRCKQKPATGEQPPFATTGEKPGQQRRPSTARNR